MIRNLLLFICLLTFSQCTPCRWTSCGCDNDANFNNSLQVIDQMAATFGTNYNWDDSVTYYHWNSAALSFRITQYSPLANAPLKGSWSFIPTATACDPAVGYQQATTYITDIIVYANESASLQEVSWAIGDNISDHFDFGEQYYFKSIDEFLSNHNIIYVGDIFQLKLNTPVGSQKKLKLNVQIQMSGGKIFTFPDAEMRLRSTW